MTDILIVEDEERYGRTLQRALSGDGYAVELCANCAQACAYLSQESVRLVVSDLRLPDGSGLEVQDQLREHNQHVPVIIMTAYADVETTRRALKNGAVDYLVKPFALQELRDLVCQQIGSPATSAAAMPACGGLVGQSSAMAKVYRQIRLYADSDATILITGESGTGKELVARAVHGHSQRRDAPFIDVHSAALGEGVIESELFGHCRGSFTGATQDRLGLIAAAEGGSLFLDEIGDMPLHLQVKLLRVLQDQRYYPVGSTQARHADIRVIAATHRDLQYEISAGRFRTDLYFRLNVAHIHLPPLRERREDIPAIARYLMQQHGRAPEQLSTGALERLQAAPWPGNVRELSNVIARALLLSGPGHQVQADHIATDPLEEPVSPEADAGPHYDLAEQERQSIRDALRQCDGNKSRAARLLGITRRRLYSRIRVLGMNAE